MTASGAVPHAEFRIDRVGSEGDGMANTQSGAPLAIPRTLPGEIVLGEPQGSRARLIAITQPSPDRIAPPCPHFSVCGGCALQHWADAPYAAWKHERVAASLRKAGFDQPRVAPLVRTAPAGRTRMILTARRGASLVLGLHAAKSHDVVDIQGCLVLNPILAALLAPLRACLASLTGLRRDATLTVNLLTTGPDILICADGQASAGDRTRLAALANAYGITRIAWATGRSAPEIAVQLGAAFQEFAGIRSNVPPGGFLQASAAGADAIVAGVLAALPENLTAGSRLIELYAGSGTISFALATRAKTRAFEGDAGACLALRHAATGTRVEALHRDLARQPLQPREFAGAAAIILDPPHAGAPAQMPAIAASGVPTVVYVSCNPAALARDAQHLYRGGYKLAAAVPIDQFLWSAQVEAVCAFTRGPDKRVRK